MCNYLTTFFILFFLSCSRSNAPAGPEEFDPTPIKTQLNPLIAEISGIADSESRPGTIWGIEDSGNPPQLYAIGHDAQVSGKIFLKGITNRDWEDMDVMNGQVLIAETGDNGLQYPDYSIYIFSEPVNAIDTIENIQRIRFKYPDGSHDCEAIIGDAATKDIYFFTKLSSGTKVYRLSYPYDPAAIQTISLLGQININGVVSASISKAGDEIIVKTYTTLFYFKRSAGESIFQALSKTPVTIPYVFEPQGEALSFADDNSGYFTLSEKAYSNQVWLYKYKRK